MEPRSFFSFLLRFLLFLLLVRCRFAAGADILVNFRKS